MKNILLLAAILAFLSVPLSAAPGEWIKLIGKDAGGGFTQQDWNQHGNGSFLIDSTTGVLTSHGGSGVCGEPSRQGR